MKTEEIMLLSFKESYNFLNSAIAEESVDSREAKLVLDKITSGIRIKFDVRYWLDGHYEIRKGMIIFPDGIMMDYTTGRNEIMEREQELKRFLLLNYKDKSVID